MTQTIEQPIGWRASHKTPHGNPVTGEVWPTREGAERERDRLKWTHGSETVVSITPAYITRAERQGRYRAAQVELADLPVQHKKYDPIMEMPKKREVGLT
jgi:hypothetical protein